MLLTGLTRDGVYLVENGEVTGAVNNFRFNESPVAMLNRITEAGATVPTLPREWRDYFTRAAMPPVRVEGFNISSLSQASGRPESGVLEAEAQLEPDLEMRDVTVD